MKKRQRIAHGTAKGFKILSECVVIVLLCILGWFLRVREIDQSIWEKESVSQIFSMAFVSGNRVIPETLGGMEFVYIQLLNGAFRLFGNKEIVGVYLQLVLQLIAFMMLYFALRKPCGVVASCVWLAVAMLLPTAVLEAVFPSWHIVLLVAFSMVLLLVTYMVQKRSRLIWYQIPLMIIWIVVGYFTEGFLWSFYFFMLLPVFVMIGAGSIYGRREKYAKVKNKIYQRKSEIFMEIDDSTEQEEMGEKQMDVVSKEPETQETVNYIENPLPIPKRHKKPMLHFDYEVPKDKDCYDVDVADNDDYDI